MGSQRRIHPNAKLPRTSCAAVWYGLFWRILVHSLCYHFTALVATCILQVFMEERQLFDTSLFVWGGGILGNWIPELWHAIGPALIWLHRTAYHGWFINEFRKSQTILCPWPIGRRCIGHLKNIDPHTRKTHNHPNCSRFIFTYRLHPYFLNAGFN
jgi:hypothetical protein